MCERYSNRLAEFVYSQKALGWYKGRQNLRFHIFLNHWNLKARTILNFGCGFGDMYQSLKVLDLAYSYSNRISLRNDYMPFEFTVFVDLKQNFNDKSVYPEFEGQL